MFYLMYRIYKRIYKPVYTAHIAFYSAYKDIYNSYVQGRTAEPFQDACGPSNMFMDHSRHPRISASVSLFTRAPFAVLIRLFTLPMPTAAQAG
jgi:hypothetical protein